MSLDIEKLKALAQAATPDNSWPFNVNAFRKHLTPAAVLELIAEIESLRATHPSPIPAKDAGREDGPKQYHETAETRMDAGFEGGPRPGVNSVDASTCPTCPKDTPYGPAFCGKCMEAREVAAEAGVKALAAIEERLALTYRVCCSLAPKQAIGEGLHMILQMPEWATLRAHIKAGWQVEIGEDGERLDFMVTREAWIGWTKDGERCRVFHHDDEGDYVPLMGWNTPFYDSARDAIDVARATLSKATDGGGV